MDQSGDDPEVPKKIFMGLTKQQITIGVIMVIILIIVYYMYKNKKEVMGYVTDNFRNKKKKSKKKSHDSDSDSDDDGSPSESQQSLGVENEDLADYVNSFKHEAAEV